MASNNFVSTGNGFRTNMPTASANFEKVASSRIFTARRMNVSIPDRLVEEFIVERIVNQRV